MEQAKILIDNRQEAMLPSGPIYKKTEQILSALDFKACELSVVIMDDDGIQQLNETYRGVPKPTNVLAFPMQEGDFSDITPGLLGDVVISAETAKNEADLAGISMDERISQLLVHGILHLVGFDHETGEQDAEKMETKSLDLLRRIENNPDLKAF